MMKERITYLRSPDTDFDPSHVQVTPDAIRIRNIRGHKETRITFDLAELPLEVILPLPPSLSGSRFPGARRTLSKVLMREMV